MNILTSFYYSLSKKKFFNSKWWVSFNDNLKKSNHLKLTLTCLVVSMPLVQRSVKICILMSYKVSRFMTEHFLVYFDVHAGGFLKKLAFLKRHSALMYKRCTCVVWLGKWLLFFTWLLSLLSCTFAKLYGFSRTKFTCKHGSRKPCIYSQ